MKISGRQDPDGNKLMIHKLKSENEKGVCK
jgi:hypothetical protein